MKFNVNSLLKDKNVLRIVAILSVFNLLGYLMMQNLDAVAFFVIIGFLATYFSKNMIVVLIIAMVTTNFLVASRSVSKVSMNTVEGMTNPKEGKKDTDVKDEEEADEDEVKPMKKTKSPKVDEVSNVEEQYENLQAMLSPEGIKGMTMETETLQKKQKNLQAMMKNMEPMMNNAMEMMDKMGGMQNMAKMAEGMAPLIGKLSNLGAITGGGQG